MRAHEKAISYQFAFQYSATIKCAFTLPLLLASNLSLMNACVANPAKDGRTEDVAATTNNLVSIGCIGSSDDDTRILVQQLLSAKHIAAEFTGSVVDDIVVEKGKAQAAHNILKESPKLKQRWIKYYDLKRKS